MQGWQCRNDADAAFINAPDKKRRSSARSSAIWPAKSRMPRHLRARGFTLLEVSVVLLVMGIVAACLAAPAAKHTLARKNLENAAQKLAWEIRGLREEAIAAGIARQVEFFLYSRAYYFSATGRRVELEPGVDFAYITLPRDAYNRIILRFDANGNPNQGGTVALRNSYGEQKCVIILPVIGRVRVSDTPP